MTTTNEDSGKESMINEKNTDPGASRHGNFMNYYQFHPAEERVRQLPRGVWRSVHPDRKYIGLDVGCNAGDLTFLLKKFLDNILSKDEKTIFLLGLDLDPVLIDKAQQRNPQPDHIDFINLDFFHEDRQQILQKYLDRFERKLFDVVFCFSVTMWIHLNKGDDGLEFFLQKICQISNMVVIEPQPWKCYRNASRRLRRANMEDFTDWKTLRYSVDPSSHIDSIITKSCGFDKVISTRDNDWGRKLLVYERRCQF